MPRVSEEHLERRRQQILDAARLCFARKGFFETSMQDVFTESGLSAGAVYRYFKSKNEIIAALATQTTVDLRAAIAEAVRTDPLPTPAQLVRGIAEEVVRRSGPDGPVRLAPQAWALALVHDGAAEPVRETMHAMRDLWRDYAVRMREQGWLPQDADTDAVAKAIIGFLPGFILQHLILEDLDPDTLARGVDLLIPVGKPVAR
ncbi:TetR/AcrR family transcriptional regulator [Nocardia amikacinitolerans]|uniref:TetR/AcrR family transcriptional regulator n=1 Tax=Nocardia amikacinitolerans TaxID=756689 RepID=UPI0020A43E7F|nr:TetR/AcrR family transcriptional regulator [Nocardia amikacinitolerans]MCP2292741.1 transcriptional regulator, TetR family [Nocardia amikacinitolerans]